MYVDREGRAGDPVRADREEKIVMERGKQTEQFCIGKGRGQERLLARLCRHAGGLGGL